METDANGNAIWITAEQIAAAEATTARTARRKYSQLAKQRDPAEQLWMHSRGGRGPGRVEFAIELLDEDTQKQVSGAGCQLPGGKQEFEIGDLKACLPAEGLDLPIQPSPEVTTVLPDQSPEPNLELITANASPSAEQVPGARCQVPVKSLSLMLAARGESTIDLSQAAQQLLPLDSVRDREALAGMPERKRPWAEARRRAIAALVTNSSGEAEWEMWRGQTVHQIEISVKSDFVRALAVDSKSQSEIPRGVYPERQSEMLRSAQHDSERARNDSGIDFSVLVDWQTINDELRRATRKPDASISPLGKTTIWQLLRDYQHGKALTVCAAANCRGAVDQKTARCERCGTEQRLPPGLRSLQDLDRSDKGQIAMHPAHAEYLTALYLGGDSTVRRAKLALERPRSASDCLEILKLEIGAGELPAPPPSYYQIKRWINEALPRIVREYAREGRQRALAKRGPYIPRRYSEDTAVNDCWICDFRRVDVRAWIEADERLYRIYLCTVMDAASRDVIFRFDLYPSAQLFKSTLRAALLTWGRPRDIWLDNGKEFTCEDVTGGTVSRTWSARCDCDDECLSIFDKLGIAAHFALPRNPNGKAQLERFFRTFYSFELNLAGFTNSETKKRPERLKYEELEHTEFCRGLRPQTPLLRVDKLVNELTRFIDARYRHRPHSGYGMHRRTPAQIQAAFEGIREVPCKDELDILLWHRKRLRARGDKVSFAYNGATFIFRADELLALPGDCEVEVHVDPLNADRALALTGSQVILLEPVNPTGERTPADVAREMERKRHLDGQVRKAALLGSSLAPVPSPERYLQLIEADAARKQASLDARRRDRTEVVEIAEYAEAASVVGAVREPPLQHPEIGSVERTMQRIGKKAGAQGPPAGPAALDDVEIVDPRYRDRAEQFFKKG